jgi:hypothetical protein
MSKNEMPSTPTLNAIYNDLLLRWAASGHPSTPECEDCGCDLTDKHVHDTGTMWLCDSCKGVDDETDHEPLWVEDFEAGSYRAASRSPRP